MKNKSLVIISVIALAVATIAGAVAAVIQLPARDDSQISNSRTLVTTEERAAGEGSEVDNAGTGSVEISEQIDKLFLMSDADLLSYLKEKATPEQLEKLEHFEKYGAEAAGNPYDINAQKRKMLQAVGILPENMPRLTEEQARAICAAVIEEEALDEATDAEDCFWRIVRGEGKIYGRFCKIAGAPDYTGGSGFTRIVFYLDDNKGADIAIFPDGYLVCYTNNKTGEQEQLFPPEDIMNKWFRNGE